MSHGFVTRSLGPSPDAMAPDGSEVRLLAAASRGSMAHFKLLPGQVSQAVAHHTVEELWFIVNGHGRMWRKLAEIEQTIDIGPGVSLSIPLGTHFQFRSLTDEPLRAIGVTMPPWPGEKEAVPVSGPWPCASA